MFIRDRLSKCKTFNYILESNFPRSKLVKKIDFDPELTNKEKVKWSKFMNWSLNEKDFNTCSSLRFFNSGSELIRKQWAEFEMARNSIFFEVYTLEDDRVGRKTIKLLADAKKRGVKVKVLLDFLGSFSRIENTIERFSDNNIDYRIFNHFKSLEYLKFIMDAQSFGLKTMLTRNHRKTCVVDGKIAFIASCNHGEQYASKDLGGNGLFRDSGCCFRGNAVSELSSKFLETFERNEDPRCSKEFWIDKIQRRFSNKTLLPIENGQAIQYTKKIPEDFSKGFFEMINDEMKRQHLIIRTCSARNVRLRERKSRIERNRKIAKMKSEGTYEDNDKKVKERIKTNINSSNIGLKDGHYVFRKKNESFFLNKSRQNSYQEVENSNGKLETKKMCNEQPKNSLRNGGFLNNFKILRTPYRPLKVHKNDSGPQSTKENAYLEFLKKSGRIKTSEHSDMTNELVQGIAKSTESDQEKSSRIFKNMVGNKINDDCSVQILTSDSAENRGRIARNVAQAISYATKYVYITNPYFFPDENILMSLKKALRRKVDVRLLTTGKSDVPMAKYITRGPQQRLMEKGMRVFELQDAVLHSKTLVIDGVYTTTGSFNFDGFSADQNLETNLVSFDPRCAKILLKHFLKNIENSVELKAPPSTFEKIVNSVLTWAASNFHRAIRICYR